jgi:FkbM family methyltransferase
MAIASGKIFMDRLPDLQTEVLPYNGLNLHMNKADFWSSKLRLQNNNWLFKKWWKSWQAQGLEGDGLLLDIGANYGVASWEFLSQGFVSSTIMFEPIQENCECIMRSYEGKENIYQIFNNAVSEQNGEISFQYNPKQTGTSHIVGTGGNRTVKTVSIDSFDFPQVKLMKVDVEGHELDVLKGAQGRIKQDQPWVFFECNHANPQEIQKVCKVINWFLEQDYVPLSSSHHHILDETSIIASSLASNSILAGVNDLFAVPRSSLPTDVDSINLYKVYQQQLSKSGKVAFWKDQVPWFHLSNVEQQKLAKIPNEGEILQPSRTNKVYTQMEGSVVYTEKFFQVFYQYQNPLSDIFS